MPIFEYKCKECGKEFERLVSRRRPDRQMCECGRIAERVMSVANFKLPYELTKEDLMNPGPMGRVGE